MSAESKINRTIEDSFNRELPKQDNYETAYNEAADELRKKNLNDIAEKSGTSIITADSLEYLIVPFLNEVLHVSHPDIKIKYNESNNTVQFWLKILLLHYLVHAGGSPATGNQITFNQITGGLGYYTAFQRRSISPVLKAFGNNFNNFLAAGERIGGIRQSGKYSIYLRVFPRVSIYFNFWEQDEDFPAEGNVVFDSSISDYLSTEDIAVMCNMIAVMIIKNKI